MIKSKEIGWELNDEWATSINFKSFLCICKRFCCLIGKLDCILTSLSLSKRSCWSGSFSANFCNAEIVLVQSTPNFNFLIDSCKASRDNVIKKGINSNGIVSSRKYSCNDDNRIQKYSAAASIDESSIWGISKDDNSIKFLFLSWLLVISLLCWSLVFSESLYECFGSYMVKFLKGQLYSVFQLIQFFVS